MQSLTILVSDMADLVRIRVRPERRTLSRGENLHSRLVLLASEPGGPSKLVRVRTNQPVAPPAKVAAALQRLAPSVAGGAQALVLPMGAGRVIAADVASGRGYLGELEHFDEDAAVGDVLAAPGLFFLEWLHWWSEWASRDHLKEPVLATTLKALQAIGRAQHWRDTDFRVTGCELVR